MLESLSYFHFFRTALLQILLPLSRMFLAPSGRDGDPLPFARCQEPAQVHDLSYVINCMRQAALQRLQNGVLFAADAHFLQAIAFFKACQRLQKGRPAVLPGSDESFSRVIGAQDE